MRKLLLRKLPGLSWDLIGSPWVIVGYSVLLYLVAATGALIIRSTLILLITLEFARSAAISPNLINPATNQLVAEEMAAQIGSYVEVRSHTISNSATPATAQKSSLQFGELYIDVWSNDGNYVTTSMVYGAELPATGLWEFLGFTPQVIPITMQPISFYREW